MAGGNNWVSPSNKPDLMLDPAVEKWVHMKESTHAYYRFTPRTLRIAFLMGVAAPVGIFYLHKYSQNKFNPYDYGWKQMNQKDASLWNSKGTKDVHYP